MATLIDDVATPCIISIHFGHEIGEGRRTVRLYYEHNAQKNTEISVFPVQATIKGNI